MMKGNDLENYPIIKDVASYINSISILTSQQTSQKRIFVYRGEARYRKDYCMPNIFRKNVLSQNNCYEKSLFDAMRQNNLTTKESYMENAIDAQHGEFPSRLLDVSYNCLNALYFAVTPYYRNDIKKYDNEDGMVYVFSFDEIYSPSSKNINECYDAIINKDKLWFHRQSIFGKNHKLIDHTKLNKRIIAQQGAFILFQGDYFEKLPKYMVKGFNIPASAKVKIRNELSIMFGINTGSIYPEIFNLVEEITEKSKYLITENFCWENEIKYALRNLQKELDYFLTISLSKDKKDFFDLMCYIEETINSYRLGLLKFYLDFEKLGLKDKHYLDAKIDEYNSIIEKFKKELKITHGDKAEISKDLKIGRE